MSAEKGESTVSAEKGESIVSAEKEESIVSAEKGVYKRWLLTSCSKKGWADVLKKRCKQKGRTFPPRLQSSP